MPAEWSADKIPFHTVRLPRRGAPSLRPRPDLLDVSPCTHPTSYPLVWGVQGTIQETNYRFCNEGYRLDWYRVGDCRGSGSSNRPNSY
jgi:hypothetical protein